LILKTSWSPKPPPQAVQPWPASTGTGEVNDQLFTNPSRGGAVWTQDQLIRDGRNGRPEGGRGQVRDQLVGEVACWRGPVAAAAGEYWRPANETGRGWARGHSQLVTRPGEEVNLGVGSSHRAVGRWDGGLVGPTGQLITTSCSAAGTVRAWWEGRTVVCRFRDQLVVGDRGERPVRPVCQRRPTRCSQWRRGRGSDSWRGVWAVGRPAGGGFGPGRPRGSGWPGGRPEFETSCSGGRTGRSVERTSCSPGKTVGGRGGRGVGRPAVPVWPVGPLKTAGQGGPP